MIKCEVCGKEFEENFYTRRAGPFKKRYCSRTCKNKVSNKVLYIKHLEERSVRGFLKVIVYYVIIVINLLGTMGIVRMKRKKWVNVSFCEKLRVHYRLDSCQ